MCKFSVAFDTASRVNGTKVTGWTNRYCWKSLSRVPKIKVKGQVSFPLVLRFGHESRMCLDPRKGFKTFFHRDLLEIIHILCIL